MEETISLEEIFAILKKRMMMLVISLLLGMIVAGGVTFFLLTPQYRSAAQLIVQTEIPANGNTNLQADINGNVLLINTYKDMIMGDVVINEVQKKLADEKDYALSNAQLKEMITVDQTQNSQMFQISAHSDNPNEAADISNTTAEVFKEKAGEVLNVSRVTITSPAQISSVPVSPNNKLNLAIGAIIGLFVGIGLAFILEFLDKTVKDERFIEDELGLPVIGTVSEINRKEMQAGLDLDLRAGRIETEKKNINQEEKITRRRTRNKV